MEFFYVLGITLLAAVSTAAPGNYVPPQDTKACSNNRALLILKSLGACSFCSSYNHVSTQTVTTTSTSTITTPKTITLTLVTSTSTATAALTTYTATTSTTAFTAIRTDALGTEIIDKRSKSHKARSEVPERKSPTLPGSLQTFPADVISTACSCLVTTPTITATQFPFFLVTSTYTNTATTVVFTTTTVSTTTTTTTSVVATSTAVYRYTGQLQGFCYPLGPANNLQGTEKDGLFAQNYTEAFDYCARVCYDDTRCRQFSTHSGFTSIPFTYDCFFGSAIPGQQGWISNIENPSPEGNNPTLTCQNFEAPPDRPGPYQRYMLSYDRTA